MSLAGGITSLAVAVRDKINAMMPRLLPSGGTAGQVVAKVSGADYAVAWVDGEGPAESIELTVLDIAPTPPPAGEMLLYSRMRAGVQWAEVMYPSGRDVQLAPHPGFNRIGNWAPSSGTVVVASGMPRSSVGTVSHPALTATNLSTQARRWRQASAATTPAAAQERSAVTVIWRGNAAGLGGFRYVNRISLVTLQNGCRAFFGIMASTSALSTSQAISGLVNCVGFGFTQGTDINWQLIHNDASGAPTQVDMGSNFPITDTNNLYTMTICAQPNASNITARIAIEGTTNAVETVLTTDIPASTTFLSVRNYMNNGPTAAAVAYDCSGVTIETDY